MLLGVYNSLALKRVDTASMHVRDRCESRCKGCWWRLDAPKTLQMMLAKEMNVVGGGDAFPQMECVVECNTFNHLPIASSSSYNIRCPASKRDC